jgi:glutamate racemase
MKIGIFDSGVGGLIIARAIHKLLPNYDYVYLGDTLRVPYGNRSQKIVREFTEQGINYLFEKENCALVILACNTASAQALRYLQKKYQRKTIERKILGVLIPAAEEAAKFSRVGVLATVGTVNSKSFQNEIKKINTSAMVFQNPAPMLVALAEAGESGGEYIKKYLAPLLKQKISALVLGCTHYPIFKNQIKKEVGRSIKIISQDEVVPKKLREYLIRHPEIESKLSKNKKVKVLVTHKTATVDSLTKKWFGKVTPNLIKI